MDELDSEAKAMDQKWLLGKAGRVFADIVETYVFQGQPTGCLDTISFKELYKFQFSSDQRQRWQVVQGLASHYLPSRHLVVMEMLLEPYCCSSQPDAEACSLTSLADLEYWATLYMDNSAQVSVIQQYFQLLSTFSARDTPLVPDRTMADVLKHFHASDWSSFHKKGLSFYSSTSNACL